MEISYKDDGESVGQIGNKDEQCLRSTKIPGVEATNGKEVLSEF